ncbi:unnamed protein product [Litomosoides sigmodontis]|uniref:Uncharacterized protein n=1 Tax=Litomosoides sigmodontis TaxID=42156 RepID=A0A3P6TCU9_LITSI|nr:unnamed protein product [Litomosoides sigmodontis]
MKSSTNLVLPLEERGIELVALDAQSTGELANAPLKKSFANQDRTKQAIMPNNAVEITSATSNSGNGIQLPTFVEHSPTTTSNEGRLQSDRTLCTLSNGVVCEFDCIDENRCSCPDGTHTVMDNGACLSRPDNHGPSFVCFSTDDLQVTWNRWMHTLKIRSRMIYNEIKMHTNYDRIFLEFGHVNSNEQISFFDEQTEKSNKVVIRINKILQNGLFLTVPYSFYTNQTIDPLTYQYGLRICAFNNSEIKNPFMVNWTKSAGRSIIYLSGTQFERSYVENTMFTERKQMIRMAFIIVPIILIVLLMFLLVIVIYMNCTRLKRFYSRRKTRNFRPFVWNGNVPPSITSGTVYEKHPSVITKSTF